MTRRNTKDKGKAKRQLANTKANEIAPKFGYENVGELKRVYAFGHGTALFR